MFQNLTRAIGAIIAIALVSEPATAEWHRAETDHFIAYADSSEQELTEKVLRLEKFDALMRTLLAVEDTVKVQVFFLPSLSDVQRLANNPNVGGFYNASAQLAYGFMPNSLPHYQEGYTAETVSFHEYAHHMLLGGLNKYVPIWATEGLATMFMTARLDGNGAITVGAPNPAFSQATYGASRWSIEKLLRSDSEKIGRVERIELYSRGWALAHYLWMSGERPGQYAKFLELLNENGDALKSGKEAFGDLDQLNREVNAYLRRSGFPSSTLTADQINASTEVSVRALTEGERAILEPRMKSLLGVDKERSVKVAAEARPVGARFPDDPFVQRAMAEIEYDVASLNDSSFDAAEAATDRALTADPENLMAMAYKGRIGVQRAMDNGSEADWKAARAWLLKANKTDPNHPLPFVLYYDSFLAAGELAPEGAVGGLYRAIVLMPQDISLRSRAAIELIRSGDIKRARSVLAPAAFYPHLKQDNPMRKLIERIDKGEKREELLEFIRSEEFDKRYNDFFQAEIAEKDEADGEDKEDQSELVLAK
ncbi:hypothetical protein ACXYN8_06045 [Altererythrobacter sp. CAU 1778]